MAAVMNPLTAQLLSGLVNPDVAIENVPQLPIDKSPLGNFMQYGNIYLMDGVVVTYSYIAVGNNLLKSQ
jgi:hypothetical protein